MRRRFAWTVRRELWESRSLYLAPLAVAVLVLVGALISALRLPQAARATTALGGGSAATPHDVLAQPYLSAELILMATTFVVAVFYSLEALHGERRDRSILFWKSLPVSDRATVLAKASIPMVVLPVLTFVITVATQLLMLLVGSVALLASGQSAGVLWAHVAPVKMWGVLLFHLLAIHGLWYAPIFAWLLLVSAWARRATFVWATLPLVAVAIVEKIAFDSTRFAGLLVARIAGGSAPAALTGAPSGMTADPLMPMSVQALLTSAGLWLGLGVATILLAATIRLRRLRGPS